LVDFFGMLVVSASVLDCPQNPGCRFDKRLCKRFGRSFGWQFILQQSLCRLFSAPLYWRSSKFWGKGLFVLAGNTNFNILHRLAWLVIHHHGQYYCDHGNKENSPHQAAAGTFF